MTTDYGLGRIHAPDERDGQYAIRTLLEQAEPPLIERTTRSWYANGWWGDQGASPKCVAYAWAHWIEDGPVTHREPAPVAPPDDIYAGAQLHDEWPGEDYDGTSVRGGAKALQSAGFIESYLWAFDAETIVRALLEAGPVVVGTTWYEGMFEPDPKTGILSVSGPAAGGHAYLLDGVNTRTKLVRVKNSWGRSWGQRGFAALRFEDLERLIADDGEACLAIEAKR